MTKKRNLLPFLALLSIAVLACILSVHPAVAAGPELWEINLQPAATPTMARITSFHNMLVYIITGITAFVILLLLFIFARFNAHVNKTPSKTTHNTMLEVVWTVVPIIILIMIAVPSMKLLYYGDRTANPEMTVKITGYQWYWGYEYPDYEGLTFNSYMIPSKDIDPAKGQKRLLSADTQLVLPVDTNIQILVTAADVIHAFAMPAFGVKIDAVPGRINETWARIEKEGSYYGQCSELCGKDHAFMPIEVRAVSKEEFKEWLEFAKQQQTYSYDDFKAQRGKLAKKEGLE